MPASAVTIEILHKMKIKYRFFIYLLESVPGRTSSMTKA
jgi:hypothetical protein